MSRFRNLVLLLAFAFVDANAFVFNDVRVEGLQRILKYVDQKVFDDRVSHPWVDCKVARIAVSASPQDFPGAGARDSAPRGEAREEAGLLESGRQLVTSASADVPSPSKSVLLFVCGTPSMYDTFSGPRRGAYGGLLQKEETRARARERYLLCERRESSRQLHSCSPG